jgi:acetylornithine deacetylase
MLAGHLDTVGGSGTCVVSAVADAGSASGLGPGSVSDRIVGRGAYDMAGGLAAAMIAAAASDCSGDLVLAFAADEEFGSVGMEELLAAIDADAAASAGTSPRPDAAIVLEPTDLEVTLAHRGFAWYRVEYDGVAAHGSQPGLGVDAIDRALDGLVALRALGRELDVRPGHPLLGTGSVRVATFDGGTDAATVADRCVIVVVRRTLPGDADPGAVLERVLAASAPARIIPLVSRPAMEARAEAAIVRSVLGAVERVTGVAADRRGDPWWTDAGLIADAGIPVVLVGPVGGGAHADEEWVSIASLEALTAVIGRVITDFCAAADDDDPAR